MPVNQKSNSVARLDRE